MTIQHTETLQRLWERFSRDQLAGIPPEERRAFEQQFEDRFAELLQQGADAPSGGDGFLDLLGFGGKGPVAFEEMGYPHIKPDFDDSVVPSQLHAAAELYFIYQYERSKVFQVVDVLLRLFHHGRMRIQRGPGARGLYLLEKWQPLRYSQRHREIAYRRAFNYGLNPAPAGAVVNRNFHRQLVGFMSSLAQYFRDLLIGEVIRGGQLIEQRPFGSVATVQRLGLDLRYALDRATYGNIYSLATETGHYLKQVLHLLMPPTSRRRSTPIRNGTSSRSFRNAISAVWRRSPSAPRWPKAAGAFFNLSPTTTSRPASTLCSSSRRCDRWARTGKLGSPPIA